MSARRGFTGPGQTTRRALLGTALAAPLGSPALSQPSTAATVNFVGWTGTEAIQAAVRDQIARFTLASGLRVAHQQFPWTNYRMSLLARLISQGPADVVWLSDAWLPEFVESNWISPIGDIAALTRFNPDSQASCVEADSYRGRQYGLPYYRDCMAFFYNARMLDEAGISEPPRSWAELVQQAQLIKARGLSAAPLGIPLAADPWLIEVISTLVFSFGGQFVNAARRPVMAEQPQTRMALSFLADAILRERIMLPDAVQHSEAELMQDFGDGQHAFAILPSYRMRYLNDPSRFARARSFRLALMPNGGDAQGHATCGWVRLYAMTGGAAANPQRRANAISFMESFGGRDDSGNYAMAKRLLLGAGLNGCQIPL
ncbi:MAG: extracellular solute-binding protein, partial [Roseococcus sp.]